MQMRSHYLQLSQLAYPQISLKFWLASSLALFYWGYGGEALGQIAPDGTLSTNVTTPNNLNFTINEGNRAGNNLFHSFREFSIPTGGEAFFNNPVDIQNIFSRVTGNSISNIDGLIRANGTANLFLINPNGIIFGPNAKLNIGGSFLGSTANSLKFGDGVEFSATNPQATPLLSINVPIGLQYRNNPGEIRVQGKGQEFGLDGATKSFDSSLNPLEVLPGKNLAWVGGNVIIDGGIIQSPSGRVELGGIAGEGTVGINDDGSLSFPDGVARADVSISNKAGINVLGAGGGSIEIKARNINILEKSLLSAGIGANLESNRPAGNITLDATEAIGINSSRIENIVNQNAFGNSGNIEITAKSVSVTGGAELSASTLGKGDAGNVKITASDVVSFDGGVDKFRSTAFSMVEKGGEGKSGGIEITTKSVSVTGGARLAASTLGKGDAGNIKITASDVVSFDGYSVTFSTVEAAGEGKGGDIEITAKSVSVTGGAALTAGTRGKGDAGNVKITASDVVSFDGHSAAFSSVGEGGEGKGGDIEITAKSVSVTGGAQLLANTLSKGDAGNVKIMASDVVSFDGHSAAFSSVGEGGEGKGGGIEITSGSLTISSGAGLTATSAGNGSAGEIVVKANSILLENQALVISDTTGGSGNIRLSAPAITLLGGSGITTNATGGESGGNIELSSQFLQLRNGSRIATDASGTEVKGGNITINTDVLAALENSDISANSVNSLGGNVIINAQAIFGAQSRTREELETLLNTKDATLLDPINLLSSDITATGANSFSSGSVAINTPNVNPSSGLISLPDNSIDPTSLVAKSCRIRGTNQLIVTGRGGLPISPNEALFSDATWVDLRLPAAEGGRIGKLPDTHHSSPITTPKIIEAQGWTIDSSGKVELVVQPPIATLHSSSLPTGECHAL